MHSLNFNNLLFRLIGYLSIPVLILSASGCSRIEFAYRNADWFLETYASRTVAASDEQIEQWRPTLYRSLEYHRHELVPLIIDYLDLLARAIQIPGDTQLAPCIVDAGIYLYERHAEMAVDLATPLLATLDSAQISYLAETMAQEMESKRMDYLNTNLEVRHEERVERFIARTERWTGKLNDRQREALEQAVRQIPDLSEDWLDDQAQQTRLLLEILKNGAEEAQIRKRLTDWWVRLDQRPPEYVRNWLLAKRGFTEYLRLIGTSLTANQQAKLLQKIAGLRQDFEAFQVPLQDPASPPDVFLCIDTATSGVLPRRQP